MKNSFQTAGVFFVFLMATGFAQADYTFTISSNTDPLHLKVGQSATFSVDLAGITPGDSSTFLSYLASTVAYNNALLSPFPIINAGTIVPDATGFVGTGFSSLADAFYDGTFLAISTSPISINGGFYNFTVMPLMPGSGTLSFDAVAATLANDPDQNNQFTPNTQSLNIVVENTITTNVPEPGTGTFLFSLLAGWAIYIRRQRNPNLPT